MDLEIWKCLGCGISQKKTTNTSWSVCSKYILVSATVSGLNKCGKLEAAC